MGIHFREPDGFTQLLEITPALRLSIERTIEGLIELLDRFDAEHDDDGEAEANEDDESWLGWATDGRTGEWSPSWNSDCELDDCDREDAGDDEPSLGSLGCAISAHNGRFEYQRSPDGTQRDWALGNGRDLECSDGDDEPSVGFDEVEHDGDGGWGCVDDESWLGWGEAGPPSCHLGDALGTICGFIDYDSADLEADYISSDGCAPCGRDADEEDALGGHALQLRNGAIIADREGADDGVCAAALSDDNGIGDLDGLIEAYGAAAALSSSDIYIN